MPIDIEALVRTAGYAGLFAIIYAETGLLLGFLLPGDSLLMAAGLVAQRGELAIGVLIPLLIVAAVTGDATGYLIGRQAGPRLFTRDDARFFRRRHLLRAQAFYERHGGKTIVLARFLAIIRTFAPTVAGAVGMPYGRFTLYNATGGAMWVASMTLLGYAVGTALPNVDAIMLGIVAVVIGASLVPVALHLRRGTAAEAEPGAEA